MSKKHQKHAKITKPKLGVYARTELSLLGTPCGAIKNIVAHLHHVLSPTSNIAYVDADHHNADEETPLAKSNLSTGNQLAFTDKIGYHQIETLALLNPWTQKEIFKDQDLVLVNGNHFEAACQILIIDSRKSLEKKLHKLTDVRAIIFQKGEHVIPDYLLKHNPNLPNLPAFDVENLTALAEWVKNFVAQNSPVLHGLVLSGGKSERMQRDKSLIDYHGKSQKQHMYQLLHPYTDKTYYAIREDQAADTESIQDSFTGLGPYGAILSAFREHPDAAWLVTACDQPFLTEEIIQQLITRRNTSKVATAFYNPDTDFPEPLVTIWEPKAYTYMLAFLAQGYSCPRKVLINTDIELVHLKDASVLRNVNTPEEYQQAIHELK
ncbi:NTP transferase domain-containing protein [Reichenbachiella sp. 5M10]|uniref:NTP transferase domain-containing protein n=1 Tax=Reichenbachiella sp. 5M10 TaxID=1889772 RepID=UPI000C1608F8|nr:NTP transferase domain-containing protein [Reichenbachiella sp. 5M10]